jgi:hypothetical protein
MADMLLLENESHRVSWVERGDKGPSGEALLRFECFSLDIDDEATLIPEGSYATRLPLDTPIEELTSAALRIMEVLDESPDNYAEQLELLSWMSPDTFDYPLPAVELEGV